MAAKQLTPVSVMSSNGIGGKEHSPHNEIYASKRRRIAFSCLDCRRRKLRCDRLFPACTRCQKSGHPQGCSYDSGAVESGLPQLSGERTRATQNSSSGNFPALPGTILRPLSNARSFAANDGDVVASRPQPSEDADADARLHAQEERIRQLENRIIGLENAIHGTPAKVQRPVSGPAVNKYDRTSFEQRDLTMKETMIFRGKSFKTKFFGASHYASYLSHVCNTKFSGQCRVSPLTNSASRATYVHEGHDGAESGNASGTAGTQEYANQRTQSRY